MMSSGTTTVSAMDLRIRTGDVLNRVSYAGERIIVERNGKPIAAIISIQEFERLERLEHERAGDPLDGIRRVRALITARHGPAPPGWAAAAVREAREDFGA